MSRKQEVKNKTEEITKPAKNKFNKNLPSMILLGAMTSGLLILIVSLRNYEKLTFLHAYVPEKWDSEAKITLIGSISCFISGFLMLCFGICGQLRFHTAINPVCNADPPIVVLMNKVLNNSVEQVFIFLPNLTYWTFRYSTEENKHEVLIFGVLFVIGRLIFLIGYFIGTIIDLQTLRLFGFEITILNSFVLILRNLGYTFI